MELLIQAVGLFTDTSNALNEHVPALRRTAIQALTKFNLSAFAKALPRSANGN
jgi:hypothetical protein